LGHACKFVEVPANTRCGLCVTQMWLRRGVAGLSLLVASQVRALQTTPTTRQFIVLSPSTFTLEVERSKFHARVYPAATVDEALERVDQCRKMDPKASHHCWAWRGNDEGSTRFSDDGEPASTAGKPILTALESESVVDVVCCVSRYFGGTKLGTGGLVRAYGGSAREAVRIAEKEMKRDTRLVVLLVPPNDLSKVFSLGYPVEERLYRDNGFAEVAISLPAEDVVSAVARLGEASAGRIKQIIE